MHYCTYYHVYTSPKIEGFLPLTASENISIHRLHVCAQRACNTRLNQCFNRLNRSHWSRLSAYVLAVTG